MTARRVGAGSVLQRSPLSMKALLWKLNRLRGMETSEVVYRVRQALQTQAERHGLRRATPHEGRGRTGAAWCDPMPTRFQTAAYVRAADRILSGEFDVFAIDGAKLGFPPDWNRDPKTGTRVPLVFGKTLNYRDEGVVGDIKYLWEPNRHLESVTLAQAWFLSRERKYADGCRCLLESWLDQCPYPQGPNWVSSLELGIRLVNWSVVWHLTGGDRSVLFEGAEGAAFRARWMRAVFEHCHFINGYLSLHSSANNHLLGEYLGLAIGSITWPLWQDSESWSRLASRQFEAQALKQNAPDGVNRENAIYYQHEVIDMMLICGLVCRANGVELSAVYWHRMEQLLEFIAAIMDHGGRVPMLGDSDDAVIVRFTPERSFNVYRSLLATGAVLFDREDFAVRAGTIDDKTRWLLGDDADRRFEALLPTSATRKAPWQPRHIRRAFPEGGYYILGDRLETPQEIRVVADAGPLGYLSIAAHGHADALSFTLSVGGEDLLIDPGTYAYHTQQEWRDYFRGTLAHNTVRIDGQEQSVSGGNFMWLKHAGAVCELFESLPHQDRWIGTHDGYLRLKDPVLHRRELLLLKAQRTLLVIDRLECRASHDVEILWHFAEDCEVGIEGTNVVVRKGPARFQMSCAPNERLRVERFYGQLRPPLGWVSRHFDVKQPAPTVRWSGRIASNAAWTTTIQLDLDE